MEPNPSSRPFPAANLSLPAFFIVTSSLTL
jgi:hypothetical protein